MTYAVQLKHEEAEETIAEDETKETEEEKAPELITLDGNDLNIVELPQDEADLLYGDLFGDVSVELSAAGSRRAMRSSAPAALVDAQEVSNVQTGSNSGYAVFEINPVAELADAENYQTTLTLPRPINMLGDVTENVTITNQDIQLFHVKEDENGQLYAEQVSVIPSVQDGIIDAITFTTDGFSKYILKYTVEFHNGDEEVVINGGSQILLSTLIEELGLTRENGDAFTVDEVEKVEFKNPELFTVENVENGEVVTLNEGTENEEVVTIETEHDFVLTSVQTFDASGMIITLTDGEVIEVKVTDAAQSDLSSLLTEVTVAGAELQDDGTYKVESGRNYNVHLQFAENDTDTFERTGSLTYRLPNGVIVPSQKTGTITPAIPQLAEIYTIDYVVNTDGTITLKWNVKEGKQEEFENLNAGSIAFDFTVQFDENATSVDWHGKGTYVLDQTKDIGVKKEAWYDSNDGKMHYRITTTSKGKNTNIQLKDTITGSAVTLDQDSIHETSATDHGISYSNQSSKGFTATIPSMSNNETVTIEYTGTVNYNQLLQDEGKTGSHGSITTTGNNVEYKGTDDIPDNNTAEAHVDNQISYSSANKSVSGGAYENGKRTMNWQIKANEEHKATITYITDIAIKTVSTSLCRAVSFGISSRFSFLSRLNF